MYLSYRCWNATPESSASPMRPLLEPFGYFFAGRMQRWSGPGCQLVRFAPFAAIDRVYSNTQRRGFFPSTGGLLMLELHRRRCGEARRARHPNSMMLYCGPLVT